MPSRASRAASVRSVESVKYLRLLFGCNSWPVVIDPNRDVSEQIDIDVNAYRRSGGRIFNRIIDDIQQN